MYLRLEIVKSCAQILLRAFKDLSISAKSEEKLLVEIRKELSENPSGWKVKQIMNIIYDKTGVRYHHEVHVYRLLHKCGFSPKVPGKKFINAASKEKKEQF